MLFTCSASQSGSDCNSCVDMRVLWAAAEKNLLKIPNEGPDEKYLLLADVLATAWHASELGEVSEGDIVAIW